jgi:hypothetical protein
MAQTPAGPTGKIHGRVINPTGEPQGGGTVSLSTDGGMTLKFTFNVGADGTYRGEATPGAYSAFTARLIHLSARWSTCTAA